MKLVPSWLLRRRIYYITYVHTWLKKRLTVKFICRKKLPGKNSTKTHKLNISTKIEISELTSWASTGFFSVSTLIIKTRCCSYDKGRRVQLWEDLNTSFYSWVLLYYKICIFFCKQRRCHHLSAKNIFEIKRLTIYGWTWDSI